MDSETFNEIIENIQLLKHKADEKLAGKLKLDLLERIAKKLYSFDCPECNKILNELDAPVRDLRDKIDSLDKQELKKHNKKIESIKLHLQREHQLVPKGYYTSIYMSMGTSFGLIFGLIFFDNLALGLSIGLAIGVAVGAGMDADAKKKDKLI